MAWDVPHRKVPAADSPAAHHGVPDDVRQLLSEDLTPPELAHVNKFAEPTLEDMTQIRSRNRAIAQRIKLLRLKEHEEKLRHRESARAKLTEKLLAMTPTERAQVGAILDLALDDETKVRAAQAFQSALTDPKQVLPALKLAAVMKGELNLEGDKGGRQNVLIINGGETYRPGMFREAANALPAAPEEADGSPSA